MVNRRTTTIPHTKVAQILLPEPTMIVVLPNNLTDTSSNGTERCNDLQKSTTSCNKPLRIGSNGAESVTDLTKSVTSTDTSSTDMAKYLLVAIPEQNELIRQYDALLTYPKKSDVYFEKEARVK